MDVDKDYQIPHLVTAQEKIFHDLEKHIIANALTIEAWFRQTWQENFPLLTSSVDLRNAGFKIAAVDTNLFPAGFNNLNPEFYPLCIQATQSAISALYPDCKKILLMPESHTRNFHYYESVATLVDIIQKAGFEVKVGSLLLEGEPKTVQLPADQNLQLHPIERHDNQLHCQDFWPDLVLLNNDLSEGIPELLQNLNQPIDPPPQLGWSNRSKSSHFMHYREVCQQFAKLIDIDVWRINPLFLDCGQLNFMEREGMDCLVEKTTLLLTQIQAKYDEYGITYKPFVIVKADAGTYGMAVMTVRDPAELKNLNRKERIHMSTSKGGQQVDRVIIQEGVPTFETLGPDQAVAEPVVYMIGQYVIGGFYRVHKSRAIDENLNVPGMHFEKLAFAECCNYPSDNQAHHHQNQFYVYSVIARLALLATCKERTAL